MVTSVTTGTRRGRDEGVNDRVLVLFGLLGANLGSFAILFFWITGAVLLLTGNGGQILTAELSGLERTLYLAYPVAVLVSLFSWVFFAVRRDLMALGLAGLPVVLAIGYYLYLAVAR
jgi:hypothetical protein